MKNTFWGRKKLETLEYCVNFWNGHIDKQFGKLLDQLNTTKDPGKAMALCSEVAEQGSGRYATLKSHNAFR